MEHKTPVKWYLRTK